MVAVKAMQKGKITDYESFKNEINILMQLVGQSIQSFLSLLVSLSSRHVRHPRGFGHALRLQMFNFLLGPPQHH
jgi:hypothetical protein